MQVELDGEVMPMSEAEKNYCFSTALFTASMTDQCAGQKKCLKLLKKLKEEKVAEFNATASEEERAVRSTELDELEFLYCGIHMGVNLAVGFDGYLKSHSKVLDKNPDEEGELEDEQECDAEEIFEVEAIMASRKIVHGTSDADATGSSMEYLVKWVGYGHAENTWEPEAHVQLGSKDLVQDHHGAGPAKAKAKAALKRASSKVHPTLPYPALPCPTLPYHTLPYPTLPGPA
jgi:hypothetical protein